MCVLYFYFSNIIVKNIVSFNYCKDLATCYTQGGLYFPFCLEIIFVNIIKINSLDCLGNYAEAQKPKQSNG